MNRNLVLDTNAYSDFVRTQKWKNLISFSSRIHVPLMVIAELKSGFRRGSQFRQNEIQFEYFLEQPNVEILLPTLQTTTYYASIFNHLRDTGISIPQNDLWIAALAIQHNLWLCTSDAHFDHIPQLLRASS
jgi:predicted nucleic acid-binding protein